MMIPVTKRDQNASETCPALLDLASKRVVVMGLGRFGGGVGVTRYLVHRGADVLVTDLLTADQLQESLAKLQGLPVEYRLGEHNVSDFTTANLIVVNPAVDGRENRFLRAAEAAGVPQTSEIRLLLAALPNRNRVIGVTGTAGKSTTTAMIGHILERSLTSSKVHVGGNLGGSLLDRVDSITPDDWVVLELSSFMLEGIALDRWSPHVAVITNLSSNHLDRHGDMASYARAKQALLEFQQPDDHAILGPDLDPWFHPQAQNVQKIASLPHPPVPLLIPGSHNQLNASVAVRAAVCAGVDRDVAVKAVATFPGLPHRLQLVADRAGVRFFNDSKSTTPEAAILAIRSFTGSTPDGAMSTRVHLILGGYDKASDLTELARFAAQHCRGVYTIGATGPGIAAAARSCLQTRPEDAAETRVFSCGTLDLAMREIATRVVSGDTVLLSPGCASWDQFENFEKRGARFVELVNEFRSIEPKAGR